MTSKDLVSDDIKNDRETDDVISDWVNDVKKGYAVESTKFELIFSITSADVCCNMQYFV